MLRASVLFILSLQLHTAPDIADLRRFLGVDFAAVRRLLAEPNAFLLRNVRPDSPEQAARMEFQMAEPRALGESQRIVALTPANAGQGLVTVLFEDDFITERIHLVFCPTAPRTVVAVQVLFDDRRALRDTLFTLQNVYGLPHPTPFGAYRPALRYTLAGVSYDEAGGWTLKAGSPPVTVFDLGKEAEAVYQPVQGQRDITGQLWLGDKRASGACPAPVDTTP